MGSILGLGRSPGRGHGYPLRYCCIKNPMDRGAWWATVHGVSKNWTWLKLISMRAHTHTHRGETESLAGVLTPLQANTPSHWAGSQAKLWASAAEGVLLWGHLSISVYKNWNIYGIWGVRDLERLQEWEDGAVTEIVDNIAMARNCQFPEHWSLPEIRERLRGGRKPWDINCIFIQWAQFLKIRAMPI